MIINNINFGDMKVNNHEATKITDDPRKIFNTEASINKMKSKVKQPEEVKATNNESQLSANNTS